MACSAYADVPPSHLQEGTSKHLRTLRMNALYDLSSLVLWCKALDLLSPKTITGAKSEQMAKKAIKSYCKTLPV